MVKLALLGSQTGLDIPQALAISKLGEGHAQVMIEARKILDLEIALVSIDALMENMERQMLHYL
jgi:hypothetical protein